MSNIPEGLLGALEFLLFIVAAYFFISSIVFDRKIRKHALSDKKAFIGSLLPSVLVPDSFLDEFGIKYKKRAIYSMFYCLLTLFLAIGLLYSGIEVLKILDSLKE